MMPGEALQADVLLARRGQFTLRRLLGITALYALLFALLGSLAAAPPQLIAGMLTLTAFLGWELLCKHPLPPATSRWVVAVYAIARWLFAYSLCLVASFVVLIFTWEPPPPPPGPTGFFAGLWYFFSGQFIADALAPALAYLLLLALHFMVFAALAALSCVAALFVVRKLRRARWLVLFNLPGVLLILMYVWLLVTER